MPKRLRVVAVIAGLILGCASGPPVYCPYGTYPRRAGGEQSTAGQSHVRVGVPVQEGAGSARWQGSGSTQWECVRICPAGTAAEMFETPERKTLRCVDLLECRRR